MPINVNWGAVSNIVKNNCNAVLRRGISGVLIGVIAFSTAACQLSDTESSYNDNTSNMSIVAMADDTSFVSMDEINSLNIIINDNNCSDIYIENICQELEERGLKFAFSRENSQIDTSDSLVITFDQQYYSGSGVIILGPYENEKNNDSDALACAISKEFEGNNIAVDGIYCGRIGYKNASITGSNRVPSTTEDLVDKESSIFTTVCFGTDTPHQEDVADGIISALGRLVIYQNENSNVDLIYNPTSGDGLEIISKRFGCSVDDVRKISSTGDTVQIDETFINPNLDKISSFRTSVEVTSNEKSEKITFLN